MKINHHLIDLAVSQANESEYPLFKIGCVIFKKNKVIAKSYNKVIVIDGYYDFRIKRYKDVVSIHAEMGALIKANGDDVKGSNIIVVRINKNKQLRLAKPCKNCWANLKLAGIKNVIYSISNYPYIKTEKI